MLRAARAIVDAASARAIGVGVNRGPRPRRPDRIAASDDLRRDGRHGEPRGAAGSARREGRDPGHGRRPAACPHEVRDDEPPVPDEREGEAGHRPRGRRGQHGDSRGARARFCRSSVASPELALLAEAVDAARMRQSRAVEIVGEPGAGKSRLVEELGTISVGFQFLRGRCEPYSASTPFGPFRAMLRPLIGVLPDESPESAGAKLTAFAQTVMPDLAPWLPLLALPFDAEVPDTDEVDQIDSVFRRDRLHDVLDQFLAAHAPRCRRCCSSRTCTGSTTHRSSCSPSSPGRPRGPGSSSPRGGRRACPSPRPMSWRSSSSRSDAADARSLALAAAGELALSEDQLAAVTERAAGNPLFIRELAIAPADDDALPETVESLLTIRIDTLEANDRLLLRHASVIGPTFELDLLAEILPDEATDPEQWVRLADFVDWIGAGLLRFDTTSSAPPPTTGSRTPAGARFMRSSAMRSSAARPAGRRRRRSCRCIFSKPVASTRRGLTRSRPATMRVRNMRTSTRRRSTSARSPRRDTSIRSAAMWRGCVRRSATCASSRPATTMPRRPTARPRARRAFARGCCESSGIVSERRGRYDDALSCTSGALSTADAAESVALSSPGRSSSTGREGSTSARPRRTRAADGASALGDRATLADAYYVRAAAEGDRGGPAREYLDRRAPIFDELGLLHRQATVLNNMGVRAYYEGAWDEALELLSPCRGARPAGRRRAHRRPCDEQPGGDPARPGAPRRGGGAVRRRVTHLSRCQVPGR